MELFNCRCCNCEYEEFNTDKTSKKETSYLRYLGFCSKNCFDELPPKLQQKAYIEAYIIGDRVKRSHTKGKKCKYNNIHVK